MNKDFILKIAKIQKDLKAPKNQRNNFGNYNYRSCEDILEALKPLLSEQGLVITISDDIMSIDGRFYVKATATITDGECSISNTAFAREPEIKKGQDESQITGASSSYARKYALNGLLAIDDTKDADATNKHEKTDNPLEKKYKDAVAYLSKQKVIDENMLKRTNSLIGELMNGGMDQQARSLELLIKTKAVKDE